MAEREQKRETLHLRLDKSTMDELEGARLRIAGDPKLVGLAEEITLATVARMMIKQGLAAATRAAGEEWDAEVRKATLRASPDAVAALGNAVRQRLNRTLLPEGSVVDPPEATKPDGTDDPDSNDPFIDFTEGATP